MEARVPSPERTRPTAAETPWVTEREKEKAMHPYKTCVVLAALATVANADAILTFGFTDLSGSFDLGASVFEAEAVDNNDFSTAGDVTRLSPVGGTANFDDGFVSRSAFADAVISMNISDIDSNSATGMGTIVITDDNGDTISASLDGMFSNGGFGIYFFTGYLSNVLLTGTTFDGTDGGSFNTNLPGDPPYEGALVQLFIEGGGFFNHDYDGISVEVSGIIVPAPSALGLAAAGLLFGARRRR